MSLSTRELWVVISGKSSLTDPVSIGTELERYKSLLQNGLNYFKLPNASSEAKIKSTNTVKRKDFLIQLSKVLNLDEWQTHELFQNYLRMDFRGSGPQLQAILKSDLQLEGFLLKVLDFYLKERIFLSKCLKYLISYWQDGTCLYQEAFAKVIDDLASQNVIQKVMQQLKDAFKQTAMHDGIKGSVNTQMIFATQYLKEQCDLVEILFLYYKDFEMPLETFMELANLFRCQHFGVSQVNRKLIHQSGTIYIERFGFTSSLVLLEGLNLELLRKSLSVENRNDIQTHPILKDERFKAVDELLYSWDDVQQQGPVLMAWTVFRTMCLSTDHQQLTKLFGNAAMKCNVFNYLHEQLSHQYFKKTNDPLVGLSKSLVYTLMSLVLKTFHEDTVGNYQTVISMTCKVLTEPTLSAMFLAEDQNGGIALLFTSAKKHFPYMVCPYLSLLTSICSDKDSSKIIFNNFEKQTSLTELFGKNSVSEIEACDENVWKRLTNRIVLKHSDDHIVLPSDVYGKVFQYRQDIRLIRWTYSYSGWTYLFLQLNAIVDNPMSYTTDSGEDGHTVAKSIIWLVTAVVKHDLSKAEELEPIIAVMFKLIRRLCSFTSTDVLVSTDVLASCLQCLQLITQQQPIEVWRQLSETNFLPSQKSDALKSLSRSVRLSPGLFGLILTKTEIPSGIFTLTKEYLKFLLDFLNSMCMLELNDALSSVYQDVSINIVFVIKEIFVNFGRWRFFNFEDKEVIGQRCLEIFHTILSHAFVDIPENSTNKNYPSLKSIVTEGLLHHDAGDSLLAIVSVGVDAMEMAIDHYTTQSSGVIQLVKLTFAVINKLCNQKEKDEEITSLEESLSHQYVQQISELDFIQTTSKVTLLSVLAKYIFHRHDPKLPILAMIVLQGLAIKFPMILTASFGDSLVGIRNAFVNRLHSHVEAVRLKVAIIEFLTSCVEAQPGIIESFTHLVVTKDKGTILGKFSCLVPILEIIENTKQIDILTSSVVEFIAALWINKYDVAMTVIKKSEGFWSLVTNLIKEISNQQVKKSLLETTNHILNILSMESYFVKDDQFDKDLTKELKTLSDGKMYAVVSSFLLPSLVDEKGGHCKVALVKSWRVFLSIMIKMQGNVCGLEKQVIVGQILDDSIRALEIWLESPNAKVKQEMIIELSNLFWTLCSKWKSILINIDKLFIQLINVLQDISSSNEQLFHLVQKSLYSVAILLLQERTKDSTKEFSNGLINLASIVCQQHKFRTDILDDHNMSIKQSISIASINVLNEIAHSIQPSSMHAFVNILQENSTIYNLLSLMDIYLKLKINIEFVEMVLLFILTSSHHKEFAEHLSSSHIGKFVCLSITDLCATPIQDNRDNSHLLKIWALVLSLTTRLLKVLKFAFLQSVIDFVGAHKETLIQNMNILDQLVIGGDLYVVEQLSILLYELCHYQTDVTFALPQAFPVFKGGIAQMVRLSVALLSRQKILGHLVECKPGDNIERLISRTKTPSPTSIRSDSMKSLVTNDLPEEISSNTEIAQHRLINMLSNCVGAMRLLTPNVIESILDEGMDIDSFTPLIDLDFNSPSLDMSHSPSFGTLVSCLNVSLKMIRKISQSDSDRNTPEKEITSSLVPDQDKRRSSLWYIIDNSLVVLISQASCYLRHPGVDERGKQFLKRELGSELSNFLHAVHRFKSRRGIPPSPISSEKLSTSASLFRRSPSKLSTLFMEEEENSMFKLVDMYTKQLLR